jgi:hypothetical protein
MNSIEYLVALAFFSQPGAPQKPSAAELSAFADELEVQFHDEIRAQLGADVETTALAYVSALAAMASGGSATAKVRAACRFFVHVNPKLPDIDPGSIA